MTEVYSCNGYSNALPVSNFSLLIWRLVSKVQFFDRIANKNIVSLQTCQYVCITLHNLEHFAIIVIIVKNLECKITLKSHLHGHSHLYLILILQKNFSMVLVLFLYSSWYFYISLYHSLLAKLLQLSRIFWKSLKSQISFIHWLQLVFLTKGGGFLTLPNLTLTGDNE